MGKPVTVVVKPGRRTLSEAPADITIGTELVAVGNAWDYHPGVGPDGKPLKTKRGKVIEDHMSGIIVKGGGTKFSLDFGELVEDLKDANAKDLKKAGLTFAKDGEFVKVNMEFPCSTVGRTNGKYVI